ncbi:MAG: conserved phage C-terminal domain-containing protein [Culicoidibacterales bacterium]
MLNITDSEYCLIDTVMKLANNQGSKHPGWCYASKQELAEDRGVSRQGLIKMINRLEGLGLIERGVNNFIRHTQKWYDLAVLDKEKIISESQSVNKVDSENGFEDVNNVYRKRKQSLQQGVNKVDTECKQSLHKLKNITKEENLGITEEIYSVETVEVLTPVSIVVNFLNDTLRPARKFSTSTLRTAQNVNARLKDGYTVDDILKVIEFKHSEWSGDEKMEQYLRPETLFGTGKFESYLIAAENWIARGRQPIKNNTNGANKVNFKVDPRSFEGYGSGQNY